MPLAPKPTSTPAPAPGGGAPQSPSPSAEIVPPHDVAAAAAAAASSSSSSSTRDESRSSSFSIPNRTLEGTLLYRRGGRQLKMLKQSMRMYCSFDMSDRVGLDFGSLRCYRFAGLSKREANEAYSSTRLWRSGRRGSRTEGGDRESNDSASRRDSHGGSSRDKGGVDGEDLEGRKQLCLEFPPSLPWTVRDVENDATAFVVEVSTLGYSDGDADWDYGNDVDAATATTAGTDGADAVAPGEGDDDDDDCGRSDDDSEDDEDGVFNFWGDAEDDDDDDDDAAGIPKEGEASGARRPNQVRLDLARAASRNERVVRYPFRCPHKKNEKALWLAAFERVGRLSTKSNRKRGFFTTATAALAGTTNKRKNSRVRSSAAGLRAHTRLAMERQLSISSVEQEKDAAKDAAKDVLEYRVRPGYAYPHRWMTHSELTEEMAAPSAVVHDLRLRPEAATRRELGLLRAEVLQCLGLPATDPNAIAYLVCGSYAFATDVVSSCNNPMWLSATRRACLMPIYHGYARLFAGVLHDDGNKSSSKDTFIGRVVIELARLKPGRTYDVTLPLRLSTSVYSRRKLGAIRLRLTLTKFDVREILRSYLPSERNRLAGRAATTVACGNAKSFRAVALAVHGKHLPGKFSAEALTAMIREFAFVQKSTVRLAQKFVEDLVAWRYPAMSAFTFLGWMHCVRAGSATLAPVYVLGLVVLQLMRNYARSIADEEDFRPTSLGEILVALKGDVTNNNSKVGVIGAEKGIHDGVAAGTGASLFRAVGMLKNDEFDTYTHKEFPFSSLAGYPRFHVEEALKHARQDKSDLDADSVDKDEDIIADTSVDADEPSAQNQPQRHLIEGDQLAYVPRLPFKTPLPEQNIDKKNAKSDKTLAEELQEVEEKAHKFTMQLFADNHPYIITDTTTPPWGRRQQKSEKNGEEYDVKRDLDKLLGLGQFSQWNPIISKFTVQIEPLVGCAEVALCAYRSAYNIFTWRDPFLSFWVSICCILSIVVLLLFPWRAVFFVTGVVALGPQNWIMRLCRELVPSDGSRRRAGRILRAFRELLKSDEGCKSDDKTKQPSRRIIAEDVSPQPIFHHHNPANKAGVEQNQTIGAQHVCIPYTPFYYHRFYDWPPDPKYGRVVNEMPLDSSTLYASGQDEIVTVRELPTPPQMIHQPISTSKDAVEEVDEPGLVQDPVLKVDDIEQITVSSLSNPSPPTTVKSSLPEPQGIESSSGISLTVNNAAVGKTWSRAMNNLNKAFIAKGGQVKETLEKKTAQRREVNFDEDGAKDEEGSGSKSQSLGIARKGRRPNINWLTAGVGQKVGNPSVQSSNACIDDQSENLDHSDEKDEPASTEEKDSAPETMTRESRAIPVESNLEEHLQDEVIRHEGSSPPIEDTSGTVDEHALKSLPLPDENAVSTRVSGDDAWVKPGVTIELSNRPLSEITKRDECKSDPKEVEVEHGECSTTLEKGKHSLDVLTPEDTGEGEGDKDSDIKDAARTTTENINNPPTLQSDFASLLDELMTVKLELATAQTENDHYRRVLKETEEELNSYRNKCTQYEKLGFKKMKSPFSKKK